MRRLALCSVLLAFLIAILAPAASHAAVFTVTNASDHGDTNGVPEGQCDSGPGGSCPLREAVEEASSGFFPGDDTISLGPQAYILLDGRLDISGSNGKVTIAGAGARATAIDADEASGVFGVATLGKLDLTGLTVRDGKVPFSGGGINSGGLVTLTDVAVTSNEAGDDGAGIGNTGTLNLIRSTVSGNIAGLGGGGIDTTKLSIDNPGILNLVNSTVSGNTSAGPGAGIENGGGAVTLQSSTITGNDGGVGNGRGLDTEGGTYSLANSVVAANVDGDCRAVSGGSFSSSGGNVVGDAGCNAGPPANPLLGPLANNGGQTDTHALQAGSPAINAGTAPGCPATDQRGTPRPQGPACDAGAFEVAVAAPPADLAPPVLSSLSSSNRVFRVDPRGTAAQRRRRAPKGTRFRFRLSEASSVAFAIERRTIGRRVGRSCRRRTRANRRRRACVRYVAVRRFTRQGVAGANSVRFSGRIRRGRRVRSLSPARYRVAVRATDAAGNRSALRRATFRIVR